MSPVFQRDDLTMFPVSYSYPAVSSSTSPPSIDPSTAPARPRVTSTFDASTIIVMLSFLLFVLWTVAIFLFAPSLRRQFLEWRAKKKGAKKAKKQIQGLGFGYDGLTEAELQQAQKQEEDDASKLPRYPPSLSAIQFLPPITIPTGSDVAHRQSDDANSESNLDPAPVYERGDYQGHSLKGVGTSLGPEAVKNSHVGDTRVGDTI